MSQNPPAERRPWLAIISFLALLVQALKLGAPYFLLHEVPKLSTCTSLGVVILALTYLWENKPWARVAALVYFSLSALYGLVALGLLYHQMEPSLALVGGLNVLLTSNIIILLLFVKPLQ